MDLKAGATPSLPLQRNRRLLNNHESLVYWVQNLADIVAVSVLLFTLCFIKFDSVPPVYRLLAIVTVLCIWIIYRAQGVYRQSSGLSKSIFRLASAWSQVLLILALTGFVTKSSEQFSREILLIWAVAGFALQLANFFLIRALYRQYKEMFARDIPTLVIGTGSVAQHLVSNLNNNRWLRDRVVGFIHSEEEPLAKEDEKKLSQPLLGQLQSVREVIKEQKIKRVYVALPVKASEVIEALNIDLLDMNVDVIWVPDIFGLSLLHHSVREVAGMPLISLNESPMTSRRSSVFMKNVIDKSVALLALFLLSPVFAAVAIAVKRSSPGPVFFKQDRHGWDGRIIKVWKFRSMKLHDDKEVKQATKGDSRVTKVGAFIRRTSIDELPQLINVLQGTMSLVGPRPHAVAHNDYYSDKINAYLSRHRIKPGITGLAQISGYRGETETIDKMQKRVEFDLAYINNWSVMLDIKILVKTPCSLLNTNIY